jgi:hypothetical protein
MINFICTLNRNLTLEKTEKITDFCLNQANIGMHWPNKQKNLQNLWLYAIALIQGWLNSLAKLLDVVGQCLGFDLYLSLAFQLSQL